MTGPLATLTKDAAEVEPGETTPKLTLVLPEIVDPVTENPVPLLIATAWPDTAVLAAARRVLAALIPIKRSHFQKHLYLRWQNRS